jgi:hypothetical protein
VKELDAHICCSLVTIKLIMGINLLGYARRRSEGGAMERRIREDEEVNFFERPPIGEGKPEQVSYFFFQFLCGISDGLNQFAVFRK